MTPKRIMRVGVSIGTSALWLSVFTFDPLAMSRPGLSVDGLFGAFSAWIVIGVMAVIASLPFVWRRPKDWSHVVLSISVLTTAVVAGSLTIASFSHVSYKVVEEYSTIIVCAHGLAILGCSIGLVRVCTMQPVSGGKSPT